MTEENNEATEQEVAQPEETIQETASKEPAVTESATTETQTDPWADPEKARREIERLRRENGDARINAKKAAAEDARKELLESLTAVLDPESAEKGKQLSVEEVSASLAETSAARDAAMLDAKLTSEAWKQGIDPAKMDYLRFVLSKNDTLKSASLTDEAFGGILESVIAEAIANDSTLKAVGTARVSGAEIFSGSESSTTLTKAQFDKMTYTERVKLYQTDRSTYDRLNAER